MKKRWSQPIGLHATPRPNGRLFDLASDELATLRDVLPLVGPEVGQHHMGGLAGAAQGGRPRDRRPPCRWPLGDRHHRECRFGEAEAPRLFESVHDDVGWAGHGTIDRSLNHRQPPESALGHGQPRPWRYVQRRVTGSVMSAEIPIGLCRRRRPIRSRLSPEVHRLCRNDRRSLPDRSSVPQYSRAGCAWLPRPRVGSGHEPGLWRSSSGPPRASGLPLPGVVEPHQRSGRRFPPSKLDW